MRRMKTAIIRDNFLCCCNAHITEENGCNPVARCPGQKSKLGRVKVSFRFQKPKGQKVRYKRRRMKFPCDKVEKDDKLGIWDENQDSGKILYFSTSRILVKKMGNMWLNCKEYRFESVHWTATPVSDTPLSGTKFGKRFVI